MFDTVWTDNKRWKLEPQPDIPPSPFPKLSVVAAGMQRWEEHCVECAQPLCYSECKLYVPRMDGNCRRCEYGMAIQKNARGFFPYGIDCRFNEWAKLKANYNGSIYPTGKVLRYARIDRICTSAARTLSNIFRILPQHRNPNRIYGFLRNKLSAKRKGLPGCKPDIFVFECYSFENTTIEMFFQAHQNDLVISRQRFDVLPGWNRHIVDFKDIHPAGIKRKDMNLSLTSNSTKSFRLLITWADLVKFDDDYDINSLLSRNGQITPSDASRKMKGPAKKVKCVAWDLDNTLWKGILVEDGPEKLVLNQNAVRAIKELDSRGIIHTVLSKNTYEQAWPVIQSFGLEDYFICPAINWNPKSSNLAQVAKQINIGLDTFAVIDDSPFERAEIKENLPMVRVLDESAIDDLASLDPFIVPITSESSQRRLSYLANMKRMQAENQSDISPLTFLRSCNIVMSVRPPTTPPEISRCLELVRRSNQLNLSTYRYTEDEFNDLLASNDHLCYLMECKDRFGGYGIVGFAAVRKDTPPTIIEIVISCRIAKKRCEHAFLRWLAEQVRPTGATALNARMIRTDRNGPLAAVFEETPFKKISDDGKTTEYCLDLVPAWEDEKIVTVITDNLPE